MKKKQIVEVMVETMKYGGESVNAKDFEKKILMKGGITGQKVRAVIQRNRKDMAKAKILEVLEKSPLETEAVCKQFGRCGGCSMLSLAYDTQIKIKANQILELFHKAGHTEIENMEIVNSPLQKEYKNKMEFTFGNEEKDGELVLGLHRKNSSMSIIPVEDCMLVDEDYRSILKLTGDYFRKKGIPHYHILSHEGYLRHLVVRKGKNTGEFLVNLVTTSQREVDLTEYVQLLLSTEFQGKLVGILHTSNDSLSDAVIAEKVDILYGRDYFYDTLLGKTFKISAFSFFQTNTKGAEVLYKTALDMVEGDKNIIFDLYSGTGTIGISLSPRAKRVIGIEIVEEAVEMAKENAKRNQVENTSFIAGDVKETIKSIFSQADKEKQENKEQSRSGKEEFIKNIETEEKEAIEEESWAMEENIKNIVRKENTSQTPELIILDPPRAGIHPKALLDIIDFQAKEILYISCNPKMLVQDLVVLKEAAYSIQKVKSVDMFPNTNHVETVALLSKLDSDEHINIEVDEEDLKDINLKKDATYEEIKDYVMNKHGLKVTNLYIAQVKRKYGIIERENYNVSKKENQVIPHCPPDKEKAIEEALEWFGMI